MPTPIPAARRSRGPAYAAALLVTAVLMTACSSGDDPVNTATNPAPAASGKLREQLTPLADCLRTHGVDLPDQPNRQQVQDAFKKLDAANREEIRQACRSLAPSGLRNLIDPSPSTSS
jgi:hypothetical protein